MCSTCRSCLVNWFPLCNRARTDRAAKAQAVAIGLHDRLQHVPGNEVQKTGIAALHASLGSDSLSSSSGVPAPSQVPISPSLKTSRYQIRLPPLSDFRRVANCQARLGTRLGGRVCYSRLSRRVSVDFAACAMSGSDQIVRNPRRLSALSCLRRFRLLGPFRHVGHGIDIVCARPEIRPSGQAGRPEPAAARPSLRQGIASGAFAAAERARHRIYCMNAPGHARDHRICRMMTSLLVGSVRFRRSATCPGVTAPPVLPQFDRTKVATSAMS